ncbi:MAG: hypothetical protein ACRELY_13740, partial [Polyangiaceae bacterium]
MDESRADRTKVKRIRAPQPFGVLRATEDSNLRPSAPEARWISENSEEFAGRDGGVTAVAVAQASARDLLRAIADGDPLVYRKAMDLAAAVLTLTAPPAALDTSAQTDHCVPSPATGT